MRYFRARSWPWISALVAIAIACSQVSEQSAPTITAPIPTSTASSIPASTATPHPASGVDETRSEASTPGEGILRNTDLTLRTPTEPPPKVDKSIAGVPLEDIVFDTFRGGFIRLSEASDTAIENLRDAIKPVYEPRYEPVEGGDWLRDDDVILGYVSNSGKAFAYPVKMLNLHEIVNDVIDGEPVLISYCPLCASGVVYSRVLDDQVLLFGNTSALYESDLVMYDHETGSYWFQVLGEAIVGPLTGKRLTLLPSSTVPWGEWKSRHPDTSVLSRDLGLLRGSSYDRDPFSGYADRVNRGQFVFPVDESKLDDRLPAGDRVFTIQVGDTHRAYPITDHGDSVINDQVAGEKVVVVIRDKGPTGASYFSTLDGQELTFSLDQGTLRDAETGSQWNDGGRAVSGPLAGAQLDRVPSRTSFWFSLIGSIPDVELHTS